MDGFPRTVPQAEKLDCMLAQDGKKLDHAIELKISDSLLVSRVVGRLIHISSGRSYHTEFNPPKIEGRDDITGEPLIKRNDDNEIVLKKRLLTYHEQTKAVIDYYTKKGIHVSIDASQSPDIVWKNLMSVFKKNLNLNYQ